MMERASFRLPRSVADSLRLLGVLILLTAVFTVSTKHFFTWGTFRAVASQIPALMVASVGMTFVLVIGAIDLSVGSVLALGAGVLGAILNQTAVALPWPLPMALAACLLVGLVTGVINAAVIIRWRLPSFIVTLGMLEVARGAAYLVTRSQTQYIGPRIEVVADASVFGIPMTFLLALSIVALGQLTLSSTVFGRYMIAIGTNEEVVRLSGVDTRRIKLAVFSLAGVLAAAAAIIHTARLAAADPNAGAGFELSAIAAVVIGGTSLMGGRGSVVGSLFGVLIIAVLDTGLAQIGAEEPIKRLVTGCVIVAAVILDSRRQSPRRHGGGP